MSGGRLPTVGWGDVVGAGAYAIQERGIANVTLEDLAAELGAEPAAVSYWFADAGQVLEARHGDPDELVSGRGAREDVGPRLADGAHAASSWSSARQITTRSTTSSFGGSPPATSPPARHASPWRMLIAARSPASSARARGPGEFGAASPDKAALILDSLIIGLLRERDSQGFRGEPGEHARHPARRGRPPPRALTSTDPPDGFARTYGISPENGPVPSRGEYRDMVLGGTPVLAIPQLEVDKT